MVMAWNEIFCDCYHEVYENKYYPSGSLLSNVRLHGVKSQIQNNTIAVCLHESADIPNLM
jgi:hypothetical protein